jgi:hypothetical protein
MTNLCHQSEAEISARISFKTMACHAKDASRGRWGGSGILRTNTFANSKNTKSENIEQFWLNNPGFVRQYPLKTDKDY